MAQINEFIRKFISPYLNLSRSQYENADHIPPNSKELEELIDYLCMQGVDPIIVGSVALVIHLNLAQGNQAHTIAVEKIDIFIKGTNRENLFRPTQDLDLFVSKNLPNPPLGWRRDKEAVGLISWISPTGGFVDFLVAGHIFPDNRKNPLKICKDPKSEKMGCPVADVTSLFLLKLNSLREKDLTDLIDLAKYTGIPKGLTRESLNPIQIENLKLVELWISQS